MYERDILLKRDTFGKNYSETYWREDHEHNVNRIHRSSLWDVHQE